MRASRIGALVGLAAALAWIRWRPFAVAVEGSSMAPALQDGEWLVAVRGRGIQPGVLVVVEHPDRPGFDLVKRVTGVPGDAMGALLLGPDEFWLTGDREEGSTDSRWFGPVGASAIRGVVVLRYRPLRRFGPIRAGGGGSR